MYEKVNPNHPDKVADRIAGDTYSNVGYVCGMSVPPIMIKRIVERIIEAGVMNHHEPTVLLNERTHDEDRTNRC